MLKEVILGPPNRMALFWPEKHAPSEHIRASLDNLHDNGVVF